ncbi:MAG: phenylacetate--CoA ligase family protein [Thermoproteota archaeon]
MDEEPFLEERGKPLPIETLPRDELEKLQNRRLRYTVRMAYETTKFYYELFNSLKMSPEDIKSREDLNKSFEKGLRLTPEMLINFYEDLLPSYVKNNEVAWVEVQTGGFSGNPKKVRYTIPPTLSNDVVTLAYNAGKLFEGDRILLALAPYPYSSGLLVTYGMKNYIYKVSFDPEWTTETRRPLLTEEIIDKIRKFNPTYFTTSPSTALEVADEMIRKGLEPSDTDIRTILVGGEASEKEKKDKISKRWDAEVFDAWAASEASIFGYECSNHDGMHIAESRVLISVANPEMDDILGKGEEGKSIITTLYDTGEKPGIFLVNYCLGDITRILDEKGECKCGRTFIKVDYPKRDDETINIRSVKLYARDPERALSVKDYVTIEKYSKSKGIKRLEIRIVPEEEYKKEHIIEEVWDALLSSNPEAYKLLKGDDIIFNIVPPEKLYEGLEVPRGKKKRLFRKTED